jgi:hypothetical protein
MFPPSVAEFGAEASLLLFVSAARSGALVINIVPTTAASVKGNMDFILFLRLLFVFVEIKAQAL